MGRRTTRGLPGRGDQNETAHRLAAIDVGTNSIHMVIVRIDPATGGYTILDREKERVRLGEGSGDMKVLSKGAMDRGIAALRRFRMIAGSFGAPVTAVATSAVREASNRGVFIRRIAAETGIRLGIVSGPEEARLIYLGVLQSLPLLRKRILLIDLGGGSTEFLVGKNRKMLYVNSLKLGAIRLTERFFPGGKTTPRSLRACRRHVKGILSPVKRELKKFSCDSVVGTSGTLINMAVIARLLGGDAPLPSYHSHTAKAKHLLDATGAILAAATPTGRLKIPGLDPARADIIAGGAVIIEQMIRELRLREITISEHALREGIIRDVAEKEFFHGDTPGLHDIRLSGVRHLANKLRAEENHPAHVTKLALSLFDLTTGLHGYGAPERELLEAASLLHEVGLFVSHQKHHQHSYYLIRNAELPGFTEDEKEIIASVARYHRKSHPRLNHHNFRIMPPGARRIVIRLAAILRVADGLDRTHGSVVSGLKVKITKRKLTLRLVLRPGAKAELELWGADQKKGLFEEEFGRVLEVIA